MVAPAEAARRASEARRQAREKRLLEVIREGVERGIDAAIARAQRGA